MWATEKLAHWQLRLIEFDFDTFHRSRSNQQAADVLSGLRSEITNTSTLEDKIPVMTKPDRRDYVANSTKEDVFNDNHRMEHKIHLYIPAVLADMETNKNISTKFKEIVKA